MLYIAVVDDEKAHRDLLVKYIDQWKRKEKTDAEIKTFESSEKFFFDWCENERYDVLFLDIMMAGITGVELAKRLREKGKKIAIIFTTGLTKYMQEGYEVEAMHYLLKPLEREKVWQCLDKCLNRKETEKKQILLPAEEGLLKIDIDTILFAEAVGHFCNLACTNGSFQIKTGINDLYQELCENGEFIFCHRSYVVNVKKIAKIGKTDLTMDNGAAVPVSRRLYKEVNQRFIEVFAKGKRERTEQI